MTRSEIKKRVQTLITKWRNELKIDPMWKINFTLAPPLKDDDETYINTEVDTDPDYFRADMTVSPEHIVRDYDKVILHETLHIVVSPLRFFVRNIINPHADFSEWSRSDMILFLAWTHLEENVVERLTDAIADMEKRANKKT